MAHEGNPLAGQTGSGPPIAPVNWRWRAGKRISDMYFYSPSGKIIRSRPELANYLQTLSNPPDPSLFCWRATGEVLINFVPQVSHTPLMSANKRKSEISHESESKTAKALVSPLSIAEASNLASPVAVSEPPKVLPTIYPPMLPQNLEKDRKSGNHFGCPGPRPRSFKSILAVRSSFKWLYDSSTLDKFLEEASMLNHRSPAEISEATKTIRERNLDIKNMRKYPNSVLRVFFRLLRNEEPSSKMGKADLANLCINWKGKMQNYWSESELDCANSANQKEIEHRRVGEGRGEQSDSLRERSLLPSSRIRDRFGDMPQEQTSSAEVPKEFAHEMPSPSQAIRPGNPLPPLAPGLAPSTAASSNSVLFESCKEKSTLFSGDIAGNTSDDYTSHPSLLEESGHRETLSVVANEDIVLRTQENGMPATKFVGNATFGEEIRLHSCSAGGAMSQIELKERFEECDRDEVTITKQMTEEMSVQLFQIKEEVVLSPELHRLRRLGESILTIDGSKSRYNNEQLKEGNRVDFPISSEFPTTFRGGSTFRFCASCDGLEPKGNEPRSKAVGSRDEGSDADFGYGSKSDVAGCLPMRGVSRHQSQSVGATLSEYGFTIKSARGSLHEDGRAMTTNTVQELGDHYGKISGHVYGSEELHASGPSESSGVSGDVLNSSMPFMDASEKLAESGGKRTPLNIKEPRDNQITTKLDLIATLSEAAYMNLEVLEDLLLQAVHVLRGKVNERYKSAESHVVEAHKLLKQFPSISRFRQFMQEARNELQLQNFPRESSDTTKCKHLSKESVEQDYHSLSDDLNGKDLAKTAGTSRPCEDQSTKSIVIPQAQSIEARADFELQKLWDMRKMEEESLPTFSALDLKIAAWIDCLKSQREIVAASQADLQCPKNVDFDGNL